MEEHPPESAVALCASCDRCRARKTKCDGARPCSNCATKYMKKNKVQRCVGYILVLVREMACSLPVSTTYIEAIIVNRQASEEGRS